MDPNESGLNSYFQHQAIPPPLSVVFPVSGATGINSSPTNGAFPTIDSHASILNPTAVASTNSSSIAYSNTVPLAMSTGVEGVKKKRGRPRKYATPEEAAAAKRLALASNSIAPLKKKQQGFSSGLDGGIAAVSSSSLKNFQLNAPSDKFKPQVINVAAGEDVRQKFMSFMQQNKGDICILSASGAVSNVCLRHTATSGGSITYEGRYDILTLRGSYIRTEHGGRTGGLSVSITCNDGHVIGGGVDGPLIAACPIQVMAVTFVMDNKDITVGETSAANKPPSPVGGVRTLMPGVNFPSPIDSYQNYGGGDGQYMNMQ